mmetsp:Transcript_101189/g.291410  ORF Transcript_101189/g.291410 Transcript_101189/m.291410 type:complete len:199 (-) Transcript_101189:216-812(-)
MAFDVGMRVHILGSWSMSLLMTVQCSMCLLAFGTLSLIITPGLFTGSIFAVAVCITVLTSWLAAVAVLRGSRAELAALEVKRHRLAHLSENVERTYPVTKTIGCARQQSGCARDSGDTDPESADTADEDDATCCGICLETLTIGDRCRRLACGHALHADCIDGWWLHQGRAGESKFCCPMCRAQAFDIEADELATAIV